MLVTVPFIQNKVYKRSEIHDEFGGSRERGISMSAKSPMVFIFSSETGKEFGYTNGWNEDRDIFYYTGEGRNGDQVFKMGNKALRDHVSNGKDIYLFKNVSKGMFRFEQQLTLVDYTISAVSDGSGGLRDVITFAFTIFESISADPVIDFDKKATLQELRELALNDTSNGNETIQQKKVHVRKRSDAIKAYAHKRAAGVCELCGMPEPFQAKSGNALDVHHLLRLSDGGPDHPEHVAAICPNCHARIHRGIDGNELNQQLIAKIRVKEEAYVKSERNF